MTKSFVWTVSFIRIGFTNALIFNWSGGVTRKIDRLKLIVWYHWQFQWSLWFWLQWVSHSERNESLKNPSLCRRENWLWKSNLFEIAKTIKRPVHYCFVKEIICFCRQVNYVLHRSAKGIFNLLIPKNRRKNKSLNFITFLILSIVN